MSESTKISIGMVILIMIGIILDRYYNIWYCTIIAIALQFVFLKIYEKKKGIKIINNSRNKYLDLVLLLLLIVLIIIIFIFIFNLFNV